MGNVDILAPPLILRQKWKEERKYEEEKVRRINIFVDGKSPGM